MNIHCPTFWPNGPDIDHSAPTVSLSQLLPAVGTTTFACFEKYDQPNAGETVQLLWLPPVSDINGWSEQPSEIAMSYLLTACIASEPTLVAPSESRSSAILQGKYRYAVKVLARQRLLSALGTTASDATPWHVPAIADGTGVSLLWDEVHWCGKACVEGLTYLTASTRNESFIEMLLDKQGDELVGLFCLYMDPGGVECSIGKQRFVAGEQEAIQRVLDKARGLVDTQAHYIVDGG